MKRESLQKNRVVNIMIVLSLIVLLSIGSISALNAKIGNGKVVLYAKVGDVIEKSVKVINDNNVSVNIELIADGDLKDQFKFKKANFTLAPNEETDATYSLKVTKEGKTTSYINVKFTAVGEKNGIILPASVIIFAQKGNETIVSNNNDGNSDDINNKAKLSPVVIGFVITAVVFIIFLIILFVYTKNRGDNINLKKKEKL